jgi:hypothetical protein
VRHRVVTQGRQSAMMAEKVVKKIRVDHFHINNKQQQHTYQLATA